VNIRNKNDQCFLKCIYRHYCPDPQRHNFLDVSKEKLEAFIQERNLNVSMLRPGELDPGAIAKFEKKNKISVTIIRIGNNGPEESKIE
jgi:hypothetical protein